MQYRLGTLLLAILVIAVSLGWWIDRNRSPNQLFLHVIESTHDLQYDFSLDIPDSQRHFYRTILTVQCGYDSPIELYYGDGTIAGTELDITGYTSTVGGNLHAKLELCIRATDVDYRDYLQYWFDDEVDLDRLVRMRRGKHYLIFSHSKESNSEELLAAIKRQVADAMDIQESRDNNALNTKPR